MSQARVTDFFSQRKKGIAAPVKPPKHRSGVLGHGSSAISDNVPCTRSLSSIKKDNLLSLPSVHEEFVRVIDEAVGLNEGKPGVDIEDSTTRPRTPKRTSAEFDLGAAVFSATANHSTAKKSRQVEVVAGVEANTLGRVTRKKARKKLILPQDSSQDVAFGVNQQPTTLTPSVSGQNVENRVGVETISQPQRVQVIGRNTRGQASRALCKEDIVTLKTRLQKIKKHGEEMISAASSISSSTVSCLGNSAAPAPNSVVPHVPKTATALTSDAKDPSLTLARAKELAAKAQTRKEECEADESRQREVQTKGSTELPAYQRYHTLAQVPPTGLSLPYQYKVLAEMFRSMDTVVAMLYNRSEAATFTKIKQGVQDMMHKQFEVCHVAQIKTVFPEAYVFRQEKNIPTFNNSIKKGCYQLTVEPIVLSDQNESRPTLSASNLLRRRHIFHLNLVSIVKRHHKAFLSLLVPPMSVPEDKLTRWHPHFCVDTVPAIQASLLPEPPHTEKLATVQEVLVKARSLITPKMENALVSLALKTEDKVEESKEATSTQISTSPRTSAALVPTALKGVSQSLLDKIRAKEAQKIQAAMTRNPAQEDRLLMMSRLPELARILRNVFVAEKRPALIMEVVCNRMVASYRSALSTGEMEKHVRLLAEVATEWLTIHLIRKDSYLKLNKNVELNVVVDKLSSRLKEEERI